MILLAAVLATATPLSQVEELAAITAELEARKDWSEQDRVRAEAVSRLRVDDWGNCLRDAKVRFQRSVEPVETVATAIFGACIRDENLYQNALILSFRGRIAADRRVALAREIVARVQTRSKPECKGCGERHA